jgi:predicted neutral ceramidase superfamily lipid hydrolase
MLKILLLIYAISFIISFLYVRKIETRFRLKEIVLLFLTLTPIWNTVVAIIYIKESITNKLNKK